MNIYANFDFRLCGQICIYAKFACMQIEICTWSQTDAKFKKSAYGANFAYVCKSINMDRFARASIFAYMQIFAHICKSVHVKAP